MKRRGEFKIPDVQSHSTSEVEVFYYLKNLRILIPRSISLCFTWQFKYQYFFEFAIMAVKMQERNRRRELGALFGSAVLAGSVAMPGMIKGQEEDQYVITPAHSEGCDKTLWNHIYSKDRLEIIDDCITVSGTIEEVEAQGDGDYHVLLNLDPEFSWIIEDPRFENNDREQGGNLVTEPICSSPIIDIRVLAQFPCLNFSQEFSLEEGRHVTMSGAFVLDQTHNWLEIHPVTSIEYTKD